jgi:hypothetical protein
MRSVLVLLLLVSAKMARADEGPPRSACDHPPSGKWRPQQDFLGSERVLHLRVAGSSPGVPFGQERCVALDLDLVDVFRGDGPEKPGARIHVVIKQNLIEHYTSRPAGSWWIVQQDLSQGSELVAFCPVPGAAELSLVDACNVVPAATLLADLRLARELEAEKPGLDKAVERVRAACATAYSVLPGYLWASHYAEAVADVRAYDRFLSLVTEPSCSSLSRVTVMMAVYDAYGMRIPETSRPHAVHLARALFHLLAMPEAAEEHENLIGTYLPNLLGIDGGMTKRTADEIFAGAASARREATAALRAYAGRADAAPLRKWLAR